MVEAIFFYLFAAGLLAAAVGVTIARSPIYAVLSLVLAMGFMAGLFVLLKAYLVATILILVYAGAVLVLFLFVVMLLDLKPEPAPASKTGLFLALASALGVFFLLARLSRPLANLPSLGLSPRQSGDTAAIGRMLFDRYLLPFELTSALLLAAVLAVVVLAKREKS